MPSKFGVPVSQRRAPRSGAGRTLATGSSSRIAGSAHSTPACGPYHLYGLVTSTSQPIAATSMRRCGARCTASTKTRAPASWAAAMIGARSGIVPRRLEAPGTATQSGALVDQVDDLARIERPRLRVERREDVLGARLLACQAPRCDVGVVIEAGADDPGAGTQRRGDRPREGQRQRRHVGPEHDAVRARPEQRGHAVTGPFQQGVGGIRGSERSAGVGVVAARRPLGHRRDGRVDHLGAGGAVEAGPPAADAGEAGAQIDHRPECASWPSPGAVPPDVTRPRGRVTRSWPGASPACSTSHRVVAVGDRGRVAGQEVVGAGDRLERRCRPRRDDRRGDGGWRELVVGGHEDERRYGRRRGTGIDGQRRRDGDAAPTRRVLDAERDARAERVAGEEQWPLGHRPGELVEGGEDVEPLAARSRALGAGARAEVEAQGRDAGAGQGAEQCGDDGVVPVAAEAGVRMAQHGAADRRRGRSDVGRQRHPVGRGHDRGHRDRGSARLGPVP